MIINASTLFVLRLSFLFFLLAFFFSIKALAQSAERSVISSLGFTYSGANIQSDCTLGEVIIATGANGNIKITQGFQQPFFSTSICPGDFDNNGVINVGDLLIFAGDYGCSSSCGITDMDNNGAVNVGDLLLFLAVFGTACS